jgi:outer membrane immunogenic protein
MGSQMKTKIFAALAAVTIGGLGSATAADMRMPVKAPPIIAPAFTWTGCYIGAYGGGATENSNVQVIDPIAVPGAFFYNVGVANNVNGGRFNYSLGSSGIAGGTLGCNWQAPGTQWVLGIEGEGGYMNLQRTIVDPYSIPTFGGDSSFSTKIGNGYGSVAGRIGWAFDRVLVYAKGGVGFTTVQNGFSDTCVTAPCGPATLVTNASNTRAFGVGGGGIEWMFADHWSVKGEYLYLALGHSTQSPCGLGGGTGAGTVFCTSHTVDGVHTGKVGINWHF